SLSRTRPLLLCPPLFPYTTLFRSQVSAGGERGFSKARGGLFGGWTDLSITVPLSKSNLGNSPCRPRIETARCRIGQRSTLRERRPGRKAHRPGGHSGSPAGERQFRGSLQRKGW